MGVKWLSGFRALHWKPKIPWHLNKEVSVKNKDILTSGQILWQKVFGRRKKRMFQNLTKSATEREKKFRRFFFWGHSNLIFRRSSKVFSTYSRTSNLISSSLQRESEKGLPLLLLQKATTTSIGFFLASSGHCQFGLKHVKSNNTWTNSGSDQIFLKFWRPRSSRFTRFGESTHSVFIPSPKKKYLHKIWPKIKFWQQLCFVRSVSKIENKVFNSIFVLGVVTSTYVISIKLLRSEFVRWC